ncbi:MAG: CHAT domain-containing protein, partial [Deltaproteobacteria bacterium]
SFEKVQLRKFDTALAAKLYDRLLSRVLKNVPQRAPLTIIPDGVLALLPFEALVTGGTATWKSGEWGPYPTGLTYVGDRNPIVYYRSLTAMTLTRARAKKAPKGDRMLVVADPVFSMLDARAQDNGAFSKVAAAGGKHSINLMAAIEEETGGLFKLPRLKDTRELAVHLRELYGADSDVYTGLKSCKAVFLSTIAPQLTRYSSMVFATHGFAGNSIPGIMEPALALTMVPPGTDGFLTMSEVAGLKMNPEIAALTACKTGVGVRLAGEGIMSMGRAFQSAGAKSITMSLWSVSEKASVMLMEAFFKRLKAGKTKLDAWTGARQELRQAGLEHPFFWAAFILVGERE